jgi:hypothetical protein
MTRVAGGGAALVPTAVPGLDQVLMGGLAPNGFYLVQGDLLDAGFDYHLTKPVEISAVERLLTHGPGQPAGLL